MRNMSSFLEDEDNYAILHAGVPLPDTNLSVSIESGEL